jgi:hypothetical protein
MRTLRSKMTYANVTATLALFMAMSGGVVWAAHRIGANQLKANSVGTSKIKRNAVTAKKIKKNAVSGAKIAENAITSSKIAEGAVDFTKIAAGTNLIASAASGPVAASGPSTPLVSVPLAGTTSFTPIPGVVDLLSIEARSINLTRSGTETCFVEVVPYVNGRVFAGSGTGGEERNGALFLASDASTPSETLPVPIASETGPLGLGQAGLLQQISVKVGPSPKCTSDSRIAVSVAVTQLK